MKETAVDENGRRSRRNMKKGKDNIMPEKEVRNETI